MNVEVRQLSECPEFLCTVGTWMYEQWWSRRHDSPEVVYRLLRTHVHRDRVPLTLVAFADGVPAGSLCVVENDCVHRPQYTPWVAGVFVKPEMRQRGIASKLLQAAAEAAARMRVEGLYIDCLLVTAPVYERNGWVIHEREVGDKDSVVMLRETRRRNQDSPP